MKRTERDQARRVMAYVDELVLHRRMEGSPSDQLPTPDRELERLRDLVQCLSEVDVAVPAGFQESLAARLEAAELRSRAAARPAGRVWAAPLAGLGRAGSLPRRALRPALLALAVLVGILAFSRAMIDVPVVSAQAVLTRSDEALTGLVGPGQLLYRRWTVTSRSTTPGSPGTTQNGRIIEEWMDGGDFDRVAGRWYSQDGRLQIAYSTRVQDGEYRPYVYFSPGVFEERLGVLNIEPTRLEFGSALERFPESVQRALRVYLDRNYIYAPITGERNFNRALLDATAHHVPEMPRILVSFDQFHRLNGTPVYRVRLLDSASVTFNWRSSGPPLIRLAQAEIVRYIARDSFLSVRTEERYVFEDGRRRFTTRQLVATTPLEIAGLSSDPFTIDLPDGTPVQRQSAYEQLSGVAEILKRVPAFTSRLRLESGTGLHAQP